MCYMVHAERTLTRKEFLYDQKNSINVPDVENASCKAHQELIQNFTKVFGITY
jgi:hypothetical protein